MRWKAVLLVLALLEPVERLDRAVQAAVQSARRPGIERPMRLLTDGGRPVVVLSGLLALAILDGASGVSMARSCVAVLVPVNLAVEALKLTVNRTRPDGDRRRHNSSFPSSHAANALALAWMLARRWPRGTIGFWLLASLIAFSRMYLNRHFMSDVVTGGIIGLGFAALVTARFPALDPRPAPRERHPDSRDEAIAH